MNAGTDRGFEIARIGAEAAVHFAHSFFDDALDGAAPSGMKNADRVALCVDQNHRQAVGGLNAKQQAGSRGNRARPRYGLAWKLFDGESGIASTRRMMSE